MPGRRTTIVSADVREIGVSDWTPALVSEFFAGSSYLELAELASEQAAQIPRIRLFEVRVTLDAGVTGRYGPISEAAAQAIRSIAPNCRGIELSEDCSASRALFERIGQIKNVSKAAMGAIDCALWDAQATFANASVGELLGGDETCQIACYASMITVNVDGPLTTEIARAAAAVGFSGQKWRLPDGPSDGRAGMQRNIARVEKLRRSCGPNHRVMIEVDGRWNPTYFRDFSTHAADFDIFWIEEPFQTFHRDVYPDSNISTIQIATGERCSGLSEIEALVDSEMVSVIQPDVVTCGGLGVTAEVRELVHARNRLFAPHGRTLIPALHVATIFAARDPPLLEYNPILEPERQRAMGIRVLPSRGSLSYVANEWLGLWPRTAS